MFRAGCLNMYFIHQCWRPSVALNFQGWYGCILMIPPQGMEMAYMISWFFSSFSVLRLHVWSPWMQRKGEELFTLRNIIDKKKPVNSSYTSIIREIRRKLITIQGQFSIQNANLSEWDMLKQEYNPFRKVWCMFSSDSRGLGSKI